MERCVAVSLLLVLTLLTACQTRPEPSGKAPSDGGSSSSTGPKRIVAAVQDDIPVVYQTLNPSSRYRGVDGVQDLVGAGLTQLNKSGSSVPELAEAVPSIENGLWKVNPDGTMETTWHIKPNARWHDGTPFTSDDLAFTLQVVRDPELPIFHDAAYDSISGIKVVDPQTVTVSWSEPYVHADWLFTATLGLPFAKHLLADTYADHKDGFIDHPYWGHDYVGTGPYKLKDWALGSHLVVAANDDFVLGRPKIDQIEVRFIPDAETLVANLLAGSVQVILGRSLAGPQAAQLKDQWSGQGHIDYSYSSWIAMYPQFIDPNPSIMTNLDFRKATLHGINRQELVDELLPGQTSVADSWLLPGQDEYKQIEDQNVTRYPYDPKKAEQLLVGLGFAKGADGMYVDRSGQPLNIEVRTTAGDDLRSKMQLAIIDYWKQIGLGGTPAVVPRQQAQDLAYRATFPGFELNRNPPDERGLPNLTSQRIPLAENDYRVTGNRSRYKNAELDVLVDKYFATIPLRDRMQIMGQIVRHVSQNLPIVGILYDAAPTMISDRLVNVAAGGRNGTQAWNSYAWDIK